MGPGAIHLRGFAEEAAGALVQAIREVEARAPFRRMTTRRGFKMSVGMTNCGRYGWISDREGYRYSEIDPVSGHSWPALPTTVRDLAVAAAAEAGYVGFDPDACLVNRYEPGSGLALHQDRNERDATAPIVSVSLGLPATFLFGGLDRKLRASRTTLRHGDVVVWGGLSRFFFHGVLRLGEGQHETLGRTRINLTVRRAG